MVRITDWNAISMPEKIKSSRAVGGEAMGRANTEMGS
jgi:hypothetical protein